MAKTTAKLYSPAISCEHCVRTIVGELQATQGVESVSVDAANKMVTIAYDTDYMSETDIRHKMRDIGYEVIG